MNEASTGVSAKLSAADIRRVCGNIAGWKVSQIIATGGDMRALEEAAAWASGDDETTPRRHLPPHGAAAAIAEILMAGEEPDEGTRGPVG